jgi:hypothetical protein
LHLGVKAARQEMLQSAEWPRALDIRYVNGIKAVLEVALVPQGVERSLTQSKNRPQAGSPTELDFWRGYRRCPQGTFNAAVVATLR